MAETDAATSDAEARVAGSADQALRVDGIGGPRAASSNASPSRGY